MDLSLVRVVLSLVQHSSYCMRAVAIWVMCVLSRAPLYEFLASEGGISATEHAWSSGIEPRTSALQPSWKTLPSPPPPTPTLSIRR
jgi:hypothetical protein